MTHDLFFAADLAVGFGLPIAVHGTLRGTARGRRVRELFWLGVLVGLTWEVPIFLSAAYAAEPVIVFLNEPPVHPLVMMVSHALWDGGLFLAGAAIVELLTRGRRSSTAGVAAPLLRDPPGWAGVALFVLYGQVSEALVEVTGIVGGMWSYALPHPYNAAWARVGGHPLTVLPQGIWLVAPLVYLPLAAALARRRADVASAR